MKKSSSDEARSDVNSDAPANPQETGSSSTKQCQTTTVFVNPHRIRSDSLSSEALSVITEDEEMLEDGSITTSPLINHNSNKKGSSTSRSIISGRWVDTEDDTPATEKVGIVDRTSHTQVIKLIDDTMLDLQTVPSDDHMEDDASSTSSYCSAIQRVKQAVRQTKIMQRFTTDDTAANDVRIGMQSSRSSDIDKETLAELKLARDTAVLEVLDKHKVKGERYGRFVDVLRALLLLGGFVGTCCHCRGDWEHGLSREERIYLAVGVFGAALLCYLSTVPLPLQHRTDTTAKPRLVHVICSRKTMLLFTYLFAWAYFCDIVSRTWLPESSQSCSCSTMMIQASRFRLSSFLLDSSGESSTISPKFSVETYERSEHGVASLAKQCLEEDGQCELSEEETSHSSDLHPSYALDEELGQGTPDQEDQLAQEDNLERTPPKNPLSRPAFLRKAVSIDPVLPSKSDKADVDISSDEEPVKVDLSFGDFRKSAVSSKLRDEKEMKKVAMQTRKGFLGRFSLVMKAVRLTIGPFLGFHSHDNEAIMDTIVEVWGSSS